MYINQADLDAQGAFLSITSDGERRVVYAAEDGGWDGHFVYFEPAGDPPYSLLPRAPRTPQNFD